MSETHSNNELDESEIEQSEHKNYDNWRKNAKLPPIDTTSGSSSNTEKSNTSVKERTKKKKSILNNQRRRVNSNNRAANNPPMSYAPVPPFPRNLNKLPKSDREAITAMLMSYYMTGYNNGYYSGITKDNLND
ncbi:uncharacterized protein LOC126833080 [Adelges cooleyi]|uniref:uncharacterized protein LOC126833080 n=1 Tax=Adelges cooleyi TaxID=133065 RepID=UPI0021805A16|nr:uncharacterized protein LOC126833080 [Adelges cooleyi]